ncbi:ubiquinol-cytochrome C reductase, iron-sulfur subunit [Granulosicoccaceae sp. 1_MG-2023]|nr:ubiquinol-cytochrome C reductase, iron-sulfur subunit [Granulosicoccaceae sp. 1_MG-2023]
MSEQSGMSRRRLLVRVMRYFFLIFFLAFAWLGLRFVFSGGGQPRSLPTQRVPLTDVAPGEHKIIDWQGRPVLILNRTPAMQAALQAQDPALLRDPLGEDSEQPSVMLQPWRSRDRQWLVVLSVGTDLGCPVQPAAQAALPPGLSGGLRDTCRGSFYDLAGRVLRDQQAGRNLPVPDYRIDGEVLVLGAQ